MSSVSSSGSGRRPARAPRNTSAVWQAAQPSTSYLRWINVGMRPASANWQRYDEDITMTVHAGQPRFTRATRLLALLLVVLLAWTSLTGHAGMAPCVSDCSASTVSELEELLGAATPFEHAASALTPLDISDPGDPQCGACAALADTPLIARASADTLAGASPPAMVEHIAPPPHQPPRP